MSGFQAYFDKQNRIYADFRASTASLCDIHVSSAVSQPSAGYIVVFRHPQAITEPLSEFTRQFCEVVPSIIYNEINAHTTITVHQKVDLREFVPDLRVLDLLCETTNEIDRQVWKRTKIEFGSWLFNNESVIVAGNPDDCFWETGLELRSAGARRGLDLRMPWGAHITAARFTANGGTETVARLREVLITAPGLGESRPVEIDIGHYQCDGAGFELHTYKRVF